MSYFKSVLTIFISKCTWWSKLHCIWSLLSESHRPDLLISKCISWNYLSSSLCVLSVIHISWNSRRHSALVDKKPSAFIHSFIFYIHSFILSNWKHHLTFVSLIHQMWLSGYMPWEETVGPCAFWGPFLPTELCISLLDFKLKGKNLVFSIIYSLSITVIKEPWKANY